MEEDWRQTWDSVITYFVPTNHGVELFRSFFRCHACCCLDLLRVCRKIGYMFLSVRKYGSSAVCWYCSMCIESVCEVAGLKAISSYHHHPIIIIMMMSSSSTSNNNNKVVACMTLLFFVLFFIVVVVVLCNVYILLSYHLR